MDQEELAKLAEVQIKFLTPTIKNKKSADLTIKIRDGRIVFVESVGLKSERIVYTKTKLDKEN